MKKLLLIAITLFTQMLALCQNMIRPNVPFAIYTQQAPGQSGDSVLFNIYIKNDTIQLSGKAGRKIINSYSQIDDYYCKTINIINKKNYPNLKNSFPDFFIAQYDIMLIIDSATPFRKVDELFEEINTLGSGTIYLDTKNDKKSGYGFYLNLSENPDSRQSIVKELYGSNYYKKKLTNDCQLFNFMYIDNPELESGEDPLDVFLAHKKNRTDTNYYFIRYVDDRLMINNNIGNAFTIAELILKNDSEFYISLSGDNTFNDLIRLLDIIHHAHKIAVRKAAIKMYNKTFHDLTMDEFEEIIDTYKLYYLVLSLSEQIYLDRSSK